MRRVFWVMISLCLVVGIAVGLAGFLLVQVLGYRQIARWAYPLFGVTLVLLALLVLARTIPLEPIIHPRRNAYRWIVLGPVSIQVSEYELKRYLPIL